MKIIQGVQGVQGVPLENVGNLYAKWCRIHPAIRILIFVAWIVLAFMIGIGSAEPFYTDQKICDAIWYIEGGTKANQEYGINLQYVICENHLECKEVCVRTVAKWRRVYNLREYLHYKDFLTFLSYKYCPPNHVIWLKNLKFYLRKLK